jgi:superfamily II DNA or RNA helicase
VQSLCKPLRYERFPPDHFGLVVVDEAHHSVARTYQRLLDHYSGAKVLGVTATPDRSDELAMGKVYGSVAYQWSIADGMASGYLCRAMVRQVVVNSIDLSRVHTVAGELNQGELDAVMATEENLHGVAKPLMELAGDRKTLVYTTSVANAHRLAEILNRYRFGSARAVDCGTNIFERRGTLVAHRRGDFQYLVNVGVLTEGYDSPEVSCIANARPTKSRALYTQIIGRGLRPCAGKENCLVLDFAGNAGRHQLVCPVDILGGRYGEPERQRAKKLIREQALEVDEALAKAQEQLAAEKARADAARRASVKAQVSFSTHEVDPFAVFGVSAPQKLRPGTWGGSPADQSDLQRLVKFGVDIPPGCSRVEAKKLLDTVYRRMRFGLCTFRQAKILSRHGYDTKGLTFDKASALISALKKNGWRPIPLSVSDEILSTYKPEPGWAG